jgi:hypothetical protein
MSTEIAKKPATVMRSYTQQVRDHASAMARIHDQYLAELKRAEVRYFDAVTRMMEAMKQATVPQNPDADIEVPAPAVQ